MIKKSVIKELIDLEILNKRFMSIILMSSLVTITLFAHMSVTALAQRSDQPIPTSHLDVPKAKLIYNNKLYDMSPFVSIKGGQLNKISFPGLPGEEGRTNINVELQNDNTLSFQFSKQPIRVDAYIADYDGDIPTLHSLKKINLNEFKLEGIKGTYNVEVHAFFPDNQYTSHTLLVNIKGTNVDNQLLGQSTDMSQGCDKQARLHTNAVSSSVQSELDVPANVLDNKLSTTWSAKGIDVMSFIEGLPQTQTASVNKNPWFQLDLGTNRLVCNIGL
ncbi:MAG TPA: hypothetical protein VFJ05_02090, partial [Nitrososphaeraceae archaeon]|nr:hypothetical protein [Nitrososphaeraceae archaeon]